MLSKIYDISRNFFFFFFTPTREKNLKTLTYVSLTLSEIYPESKKQKTRGRINAINAGTEEIKVGRSKMIVPVACGLQPNLASSKIGLEPAFSRSLPRLCNESNRVL